MMEQVKIMVDEQTKLTLKQLQDALAVLLAPLEKLNAPQTSAMGGDATSKIADDVRRLSRDIEDGFADVTRKVGDVLTAQEDLFAKFAAIAKRQEEMSAAMQSLSLPKPVVEETPAAPKQVQKKKVRTLSKKVAKKVLKKKVIANKRPVKSASRPATKGAKGKDQKKRK